MRKRHRLLPPGSPPPSLAPDAPTHLSSEEHLRLRLAVSEAQNAEAQLQLAQIRCTETRAALNRVSAELRARYGDVQIAEDGRIVRPDQAPAPEQPPETPARRTP